jgi:hypothetical protein
MTRIEGQPNAAVHVTRVGPAEVQVAVEWELPTTTDRMSAIVRVEDLLDAIHEAAPDVRIDALF